MSSKTISRQPINKGDKRIVKKWDVKSTVPGKKADSCLLGSVFWRDLNLNILLLMPGRLVCSASIPQRPTVILLLTLLTLLFKFSKPSCFSTFRLQAGRTENCEPCWAGAHMQVEVLSNWRQRGWASDTEGALVAPQCGNPVHEKLGRMLRAKLRTIPNKAVFKRGSNTEHSTSDLLLLLPHCPPLQPHGVLAASETSAAPLCPLCLVL